MKSIILTGIFLISVLSTAQEKEKLDSIPKKEKTNELQEVAVYGNRKQFIRFVDSRNKHSRHSSTIVFVHFSSLLLSLMTFELHRESANSHKPPFVWQLLGLQLPRRYFDRMPNVQRL